IQGRRTRGPGQARTTQAANRTVEPAPQLVRTTVPSKLVFVGLCVSVGVWAYWPTIFELVTMWNREPDYSHGYLVVPLALAFLWMRRNSYPGLQSSSPLLGLALLGASLAL